MKKLNKKNTKVGVNKRPAALPFIILVLFVIYKVGALTWIFSL